MYNRYIPAETSYTAIQSEIPQTEGEKHQRTRAHPASQVAPLQALFAQKGGLHRILGGETSGVGKLLKTLKLERFDSGDLLVLLIVLLLLSEGDDWDPIIALGLFLVLELMEP